MRERRVTREIADRSSEGGEAMGRMAHSPLLGDILAESRRLVARAREYVGGIDEQLLRASYPLLAALAGCKEPGIKAMLVHGPGGSGKSAMVDAMVRAGSLECVRSNAADLYSPIMGETEDAVSELFKDAVGKAPCVLVIDNVENIASLPKREGEVQERRALTRFLSCLDALPHACKVFIVGITGRAEALDRSVYRGGRFDLCIPLSLPSRDARLAILNILCKTMPLDLEGNPGMLERIADRSHGYGPSDLLNLLKMSLEGALEKQQQQQQQQGGTAAPRLGGAPLVGMSELDAAASVLRPSVLRDRPPMSNLPLGWDELHGIDEAKHKVGGDIERTLEQSISCIESSKTLPLASCLLPLTSYTLHLIPHPSFNPVFSPFILTPYLTSPTPQPLTRPP